MRLDDRDKGYAWVVVGAGAIVMFIGPSTFTAYGILFGPIELGSRLRLWILNLTCILWFGIASLAGPLATLNTNRKIVMFGLFSATCGLTLTGLTTLYPFWSLLTFSIVVGIGVGISIHETFFLIVCHFEQYRGLAIGLLQLSALIGQIITPLIYKSLPEVKDCFYIRALLTAISFMSASFYISPHILRASDDEKTMEDLGDVESNHSRPTHSKTRFLKKSNQSENSKERDSHREAEVHPLVTVHQNQNDNAYLHHKHLDPAHFLPKIPEEAESMLSITSTGSSKDELDELMLKFKITPIDSELEKRIELKVKKSISTSEDSSSSSSHAHQKHSIKPLTVDLVKKVEEKIQSSTRNVPIPNNNRPIRVLRKSESTGQAVTRRSMFRYRLDSVFDPEKKLTRRVSNENKKTEENNGLGQVWKEAIMETTNWNLLHNWRFVQMSLTCALTIVVFPNFPIILISHLLAIEKEKTEFLNVTTTMREVTEMSFTADGHDNIEYHNVNSVLTMIYISDGISRLTMAYCSDYSLFSRKTAFFLASLIGGFLIIGTSFTKDIEVIHVICCLYGLCYGTLVVTESLMFLDAFGVSKLPTTYGLMNTVKVLIILLLSLTMTSPMTGFIYPIQPFLPINSWNDTTCHGDGCDPLDIFNQNESSTETLKNTSLLFLWIGICGIFTGVAWILEVLWNLYSDWKKEKEKKNLKSETEKEFFLFPGLRRPRSNSNPV